MDSLTFLLKYNASPQNPSETSHPYVNKAKNRDTVCKGGIKKIVYLEYLVMRYFPSYWMGKKHPDYNLHIIPTAMQSEGTYDLCLYPIGSIGLAYKPTCSWFLGNLMVQIYHTWNPMGMVGWLNWKKPGFKHLPPKLVHLSGTCRVENNKCTWNHYTLFPMWIQSDSRKNPISWRFPNKIQAFSQMMIRVSNHHRVIQFTLFIFPSPIKIVQILPS